MKRSFVLAAAVSAAAWLMAGCGQEQSPPPRVHDNAKPDTELAKKTKPVKLPKLAPPGTAAYLDLKNGFRDVVFGTPATNFSDLVLQGKDDAAQTATYTRSGDVLSLAGVPLQEIDYTFFQDQLSKVTVKWKLEFVTNDFSVPPNTGLAASCTELYGRPKQHQVQRESTEYVWSGQRVKILLDEIKLPGVANPGGGGWAVAPVTSGEMVIQSIPLCRDMDVYISSQSAQQDNKAGL
jgi:hypothetical protein